MADPVVQAQTGTVDQIAAQQQQQQTNDTFDTAFDAAVGLLRAKGVEVFDVSDPVTGARTVNMKVNGKTVPAEGSIQLLAQPGMDEAASTQAIVSALVEQIRAVDPAVHTAVTDGFAEDKFVLVQTAATATATTGPDLGNATKAWDASANMSSTEIGMWIGVDGGAPTFRNDDIVKNPDDRAVEFLGNRSNGQLGLMAQDTGDGRTALTNMWQALDDGRTTGAEDIQVNRISVAMATTTNAEGAAEWLGRAEGDEGRGQVIGALLLRKPEIGQKLLGEVIAKGDDSLFAEVFTANPNALNGLDEATLTQVTNLSVRHDSSINSTITRANRAAEQALVTKAERAMAGNGTFDIAAVAGQDRQLATRIMNGVEVPTAGTPQAAAYATMLSAYSGAVPKGLENLSDAKLAQVFDLSAGDELNAQIVGELTSRVSGRLRQNQTPHELNAIATASPAAFHAMMMDPGFRETIMKNVDGGFWSGDGTNREGFLNALDTTLKARNANLTPVQKGEMADALLADERIGGLREHMDLADADRLRDGLRNAVKVGKAAAAALGTVTPEVANDTAGDVSNDPANDAILEAYTTALETAKAEAATAFGDRPHTIEIDGEAPNQTAIITVGDQEAEVELTAENVSEALGAKTAELIETHDAQVAAVATQRTERWNRVVQANIAGLESMRGENIPTGGTALATRIADVGRLMEGAGFKILGPSEGDTAKVWGSRMTAATGAASAALGGNPEPGEIEKFLEYVGETRVGQEAAPNAEELAAFGIAFRATQATADQSSDAVVEETGAEGGEGPSQAVTPAEIAALRSTHGTTPASIATRTSTTNFVTGASPEKLAGMAQTVEGREYLAEAYGAIRYNVAKDKVATALALNPAPAGATMPTHLQSPATYVPFMGNPSPVMQGLLESDNATLQKAGRDIMASGNRDLAQDRAAIAFLDGQTPAQLQGLANNADGRGLLASMYETLDRGDTSPAQETAKDTIATAMALGQPVSEARVWADRAGHRFGLALNQDAPRAAVTAQLLQGTLEQNAVGNQIFADMMENRRGAARRVLRADGGVYGQLSEANLKEITSQIGTTEPRPGYSQLSRRINTRAKEELASRSPAVLEGVGTPQAYDQLTEAAERNFARYSGSNSSTAQSANLELAREFGARLDPSALEGLTGGDIRGHVYDALVAARARDSGDGTIRLSNLELMADAVVESIRTEGGAPEPRGPAPASDSIGTARAYDQLNQAAEQNFNGGNSLTAQAANLTLAREFGAGLDPAALSGLANSEIRSQVYDALIAARDRDSADGRIRESNLEAMTDAIVQSIRSEAVDDGV